MYSYTVLKIQVKPTIEQAIDIALKEVVFLIEEK